MVKGFVKERVGPRTSGMARMCTGAELGTKSPVEQKRKDPFRLAP